MIKRCLKSKILAEVKAKAKVKMEFLKLREKDLRIIQISYHRNNRIT